MSRLDSSYKIQKLAQDLGLSMTARPCGVIMDALTKRVRKICQTYNCASLSDLLNAVAAEVKATFLEIQTDAELEEIQARYVKRGELIFGNLVNDLSKTDDYGLTIKLIKPEPWECPYICVIDCRGDKKFRSYFTKWHELAHLLTLTPQTRLMFRRSHSRECADDPEEKLMDVIAGAFGFFVDLMPEELRQEVSFQGIAAIREEFCPEASVQASLIGIVKALPTPCILLHVEPATTKREAERFSHGASLFGETSVPEFVLRAIHATVNPAAREADIKFIKNWRVPMSSVIQQVFETGVYSEADEDLSWWKASSGSQLQCMPVRVKARKVWGGVDVLMIPLAA